LRTPWTRRGCWSRNMGRRVSRVKKSARAPREVVPAAIAVVLAAAAWAKPGRGSGRRTWPP